MFILGVGAAHPEVEVSDNFLAALGLVPTEQERELLARFGVRSRRGSLPQSYIQSTKNAEVLDGRVVATATPTSLGAEAARQAVERAGISIEQIGLVIADTSTPYQTCPSEAQRIAGALSLKVPAYDVVVGSAALPLALDMLSSWKPERIPEYVLYVSTSTPSQHISYTKNALSAYLFGDAASAFILSPRSPGRLKVCESYLERRGALQPSAVVERHISFSSEALLAKEDVAGLLGEGLARLSKKESAAPVAIVGPQLYGGEFAEYERSLGLRSGTMVQGTAATGYALGASSGVALASLWDDLKPGEHVAVFHVGDGILSGSILLASE